MINYRKRQCIYKGFISYLNQLLNNTYSKKKLLNNNNNNNNNNNLSLTKICCKNIFTIFSQQIICDKLLLILI